MAKAVVPIARPVTIRASSMPRVLVVPMENFPTTTFKPRWNLVKIVPMADIHLLLVYPAQFFAVLVLPENIPKK